MDRLRNSLYNEIFAKNNSMTPFKILVIETGTDLTGLINRQFSQRIQSKELRFLFARDGLEALKQVETHPDISVIFSEMDMPQMDGLTLLKELHNHAPLLPIIAIFSTVEMHTIRTAMNHGAYDFLTKPVAPEDLEATLHKALHDVQHFRDAIAAHKWIEDNLKTHQDHLEEEIRKRTVELTAANESLQQEVFEHKQAEKLLQQRNKELALINQINKMFSSSIDLDRVLATVLRSVRHLLNISATSFWVCVPETGELVCQHAIGVGHEVTTNWRLAPGQGITGQAAQSGKPLIIGDTRIDARHNPAIDQKSGIELRSILSIPFRVKGIVIGVLNSLDQEANRFTEDDLRLIEPIATAAAVAVENARLYTRAQQEIFERQKIEDALRESEEQYRTLFQNLNDVFYRVDLKGNIVLVSPSILGLLGYPDQDARGLNLAKDVLVHPEQWDDLLMLMETDGHLDNFEILFQRSDGSLDWGSASARFYKDEEGNHLGVEGIIRDISIRKQAELQLLAAHDALQNTNVQLQELNASKDKFFSIISHDLKGSFKIVLGYSQLIAEQFEQYSHDEIKIYAGKLRESAERLYALLENLLTWSRIQRGVIEYTPEIIDMSELAEENMDLFLAKAEHKQITLRNAVGTDKQVRADYNMVSTILRNLVSNALKFTPSAGWIEVSTRSNGTCLEVAVSDTGTGISDDDIPKLFRIDAQYTNVGTDGEKGTGLGLSLCQDLVEKNGGEIWVESEPGKGTTFSFTLPFPSEQALQ